MFTEIAATTAAVAAIMVSVNSIMENVDETLKHVESIINTLNRISKGPFAEKLGELSSVMQKVFVALVDSIKFIFEKIKVAMEKHIAKEKHNADALKAALDF